jgi:hypothetical protein
MLCLEFKTLPERVYRIQDLKWGRWRKYCLKGYFVSADECRNALMRWERDQKFKYLDTFSIR